MKITYYGHATLLVEMSGKKLLFDPFITGNPKATDIDLNAIEADYILITHGHQDHVLDVETIAKRTGAKLISNFEIISWFEQKGLSGHPMNTGGKFDFDFGTVKYVHALHSSALPDGSNGGNPGGFVVWNHESCIYVAGDTALTEDMKLIPRTCPALDLAVLPVGDNFTMGFDDAILASEMVQCKKVMAYHFDTFPPIEINHDVVEDAFNVAGIDLVLPEIGEALTI